MLFSYATADTADAIYAGLMNTASGHKSVEFCEQLGAPDSLMCAGKTFATSYDFQNFHHTCAVLTSTSGASSSSMSIYYDGAFVTTIGEVQIVQARKE